MPAAVKKPNLHDPVTSHLHQQFTCLQATQTVAAAHEWLRAHPPGERIIYFYVLDDAGRLQGVVPTRRLVLSPPETPIADIMVRNVITLPADATVLDACEFFIQHRMLAFPVVDADRRMLGVVDVELYTSELDALDEADKRNQLFQLIGVRMADRLQDSSWSAFRRRFPWLGCNLVAGIFAAFVVGAFETELNKVIALSFFIPVVLNLAESVSSQSVSLALQLLHGQSPTWKGLREKLRAELAVGLLLGLGCGAAVALVALIWLQQPLVALCLIGGIAGGVTIAALFGISIPVLLRLVHLEPRVAAGPVALAGADVVTILFYLCLARWVVA